MSEIETAERIEDMRLAASSIREWMPETLPANEDGQIHFARALAESAATAIEKFIGSTPPAAPVREGIEVTAEAHRVAMANTDDADVRTVLLAVLGCAQSWVGEARIIGNVRAADIVRALSSALSASPSPVDSRDGLIERLVKAKNVWADYGNGFRIHFEFDRDQDISIVAEVNAAALAAKEQETER